MTGTTKLTPFEQAQMNRKIYPARIKLCENVIKLIKTLEELETVLDALSVQDMPVEEQDQVIKSAVKERDAIVQQLTLIADVWEEAEGVTA
tara:strand:- start:587 stop:859 length:273 start_codon:yes stop_codon:yes gene_type:complete